jgi:hypothetical protein
MILSYQLPLTQLLVIFSVELCYPKLVMLLALVLSSLEVVTAEVNGSLVMVNKANRVNKVHMANPLIACMSI